MIGQTSLRGSKSLRRGTGIAVAISMAAGVLTAPAAFAADGVTHTGNLGWGIKESFIKYLGSPIAHGTITAEDGATYTEGGTPPFNFTLNNANVTDADTATYAFDGTVKLYGHDGGMDVTYTDLKVNVDGDKAVLTLDYIAKSELPGQAPKSEEGDDVAFVNIALEETPDLTADKVSFTGQTELTAEGEPAFAGFYKAGLPLDPITVSVEKQQGEQPGNPDTPDNPGTSGSDLGDGSSSSSENEDFNIFALVAGLLGVGGIVSFIIAALNGQVPGLKL